MTRALPYLLLCVLGGIALGAMGVVLVLQPAAPTELVSSEEPVRLAPVSSGETDDTRTVEIDLAFAEPTTIGVPVAGVVTALADCRDGVTLTSGRTPLRINDVPILPLATELPLYRDLGPATQGRDVRALNAELARLGYRVPAGPRFGPATLRAVKRLYADNRFRHVGDQLAVAGVIWLPQPEVRLDTCDITRGDTVEPGATLGSSRPAMAQARLRVLPEDAIPGARSLTLDGVTVAVSAEGAVDDPAVLAQLASTPTVRARASQDDDSGEFAAPLTANWALAEPLAVYTVAPSAVVIDGDRACLVDRSGRVLPVTVVDSRLGRSVLTAESELPEQVVIDEDARCG